MSTPTVLRPDIFHTPERKIRLLLASLPFFAGLLSVEGEVLECNFGRLGTQMTERSDWVGQRFEDGPWWSYSEPSRAEVRALLAEAATGKRVSAERLYRQSDGSMGVMILTLTPLFAPGGEADAVLVVAVDVTERRTDHATPEGIAADMAHRLRNSFTLMRLLATRGQAGPLAAARASARLARVRAAHNLTYRYLFFDVPVETIIRETVVSQQIGALVADPVSIPSPHVEALILALGELAAEGRSADITAERVGDSHLRLRWAEAEPRSTEAMPQNLSLLLIDGSLAMQVEGQVSVTNAPFTWTLDMPL